ncbi:MAG: aminoacyl-tRNA hydrolase [Spirochaetales bacterium]|nr:aminoacyl-tRNA hydrolase [Spirochaetales bacterium]
MIDIIAFLGNTGKQYAYTRHNLPWILIDYLSSSPGLVWKEKFHGAYTFYPAAERKIILVKPHTYMNKSGECIQKVLHFFKTLPGQLLVIHDDTELDFAQIDFKSGGGLSGHNGLRHLVSSIGTKDFKRMRLGISRPSHGNLSSYVLGVFNPDESAVLPRYLVNAAEALEYCISHGFESAREKFQKKYVLG